MAGAILIAACTSLPDLMVNIIGVFVWSQDEFGFEWFVGSSVFNILILVGVGGLATREALR